MPSDPNLPKQDSSHTATAEPPRDELVVVNHGVPSTGGAGWYGGPPPQPPALNPGLDPIWVLHSLRRRWVLATGIGLIFAAVAAGAIWLLTPSMDTAEALLRVNESEQAIWKKVDPATDFSTYKRTQGELIRSHFVLTAALRDPERKITDTDVLRDEPDPVAFLASNLEISFPGNAEVLRIAFEAEDGEDAKKIVDAVKNAYLQEIVYKEVTNKLQTKNLLEKSLAKLREEVRSKTEQFFNLAEQLKLDTDSDVDKRFALDQMARMMKREEDLTAKLQSIQIQLYNLEQRRRSPQLIDQKIDERIAEDPQIQQLQNQMFMIDGAIDQMSSLVTRANDPNLKKYYQQKQATAQQLNQRMAELRPRIKQEVQSSPDPESLLMLKSLQVEQAAAAGSLQKLQTDMEDKMAELKEMHARSLELEQREMDLEQLREVVRGMGSKLEAWEIELNAPPRISTLQNPTVKPGLDTVKRASLTGVGGFFAFALVSVGIALFDYRKRRLNGANQVDEGLGIPVLGELPSLNYKKLEKQDDPHVAALTQAVDNVRTRLMHFGTSRETRVVMVSTASGREGSTTVASQLAASLARAGRRTLIVDGDIRYPSLHRMFDAPLEDGLCEVLRSDVDVMDVVRPTQVEDLWVLTAGMCDVNAVQALGRGQAEPIFEKLRQSFDFIVVDAAPVLTVADSLIIGQYVDGAILSTLRDVSQVPQVHEAGERLKSVGIRMLGSVVNGVSASTDRQSRMRLIAPVQNGS